jgi:hypothetical protein
VNKIFENLLIFGNAERFEKVWAAPKANMLKVKS